MKVYRFQVYSSIIHHLYIVLCVHHPTITKVLRPFIALFEARNCIFPLFSTQNVTAVLSRTKYYKEELSLYNTSPT